VCSASEWSNFAEVKAITKDQPKDVKIHIERIVAVKAEQKQKSA
jgi:hypothetical protein